MARCSSTTATRRPGAGALPDAAADDVGVLRRRSAAPAELGLHPAGRVRGSGVLQRVWSNVLRLTFRDQLPESLWPAGGQRWMAVVDRPASPAAQPVVGRRVDRRCGGGPGHDPGQGDARGARRADAQSRAQPPSAGPGAGCTSSGWRTSRSVRAGWRAVRALFNRGPWAVGGGGASVDATNWDATHGYDVTSAPSMRMVVDLGDLERSRWVNLTGASGHVASGHYRDQTPLWVKGQTLPWAFDRAAVRKASKDHLVLEPTRTDPRPGPHAGRARGNQLRHSGSRAGARAGARRARWRRRSPGGRGRRGGRWAGPPRS